MTRSTTGWNRGVRRTHRRVAQSRSKPERTSVDHGHSLFRAALPGPEHGKRESLPDNPMSCPRPARSGRRRRCRWTNTICGSSTTGSGEEFVRRLWWRATVELPDDPLLHTCRRVRHRRVPHRPRAAGARTFDAVANPSQRHHRFVDLVPSPPCRPTDGTVELPVARGVARTWRRHCQPESAMTAWSAATLVQKG